jgi:class 3 adenylate cyclase
VQLEGERRLATIILADIKGSTAIGERMSTEDFIEILNQVLQILELEIYRYGGEVDQFRGDCVVAFFGTKVAHENDPERAVLAALAMQEVMKTYTAELAGREGIELRLRVGVNTGEVIAARIGDSRLYSEDTAMGQAVALANRLQTAAEPGTVLVSENTYRLTQPLFEWQPLGEIMVKGVSQPVAVYRPLAAKAIPGKLRGIPGLASPLVGRQAEFRTLQEAIERLRAGVGGIVTIAGEAGIGKSRLVAELRKRGRSTERHALQWIEGRCLSYGATIAYQLWLDMLRELLRVAADAPQAIVHDALGELVQRLCPDCFDDVF